MTDNEGTLVHIITILNKHILAVGKSGSGKTFWLMQRIHELLAEAKKILILDFSGSYSKRELEKSNPALLEKIKFFGSEKSGPIEWANPYKSKSKLCDNVADAIVKVLKITSYFQKKLLRTAVERQLEEEPTEFSFPLLVIILETMLEEEKEKRKNKELESDDDLKNLERLLARLDLYKEIENFCINMENKENNAEITVIQLDEMSEQQKKFLTLFLMEMICKELNVNDKKPCCDVLVLDEFQFLPLKEGDALPKLLRESRKSELEINLLTQFISNYSKDEINLLLQADQKLFFKPTEKDLKFIAGLIAPTQTTEWMRILDGLSRGEAVFKGNYSLDENPLICQEPIVCKI